MGVGGISIWQLIILFLLVFPLVHVAISKKVSGWSKFFWLVAVLIFSWLAYIVFLLMPLFSESTVPNDNVA
ncbi:hypothetical protein [uncultured Microbulbifer sp.]|uniref:hypothetical protein n=1 Tax=uncultured Microbulbifer sp. TaxID=348147 RepID=UPI00262AEA1A|nr:hypothetical protein [uncultured Microbulbifer sp.]